MKKKRRKHTPVPEEKMLRDDLTPEQLQRYRAAYGDENRPDRREAFDELLKPAAEPKK